ncbi:GNAT family N-acetyltransferase [Kocuria tytonis]|uniref:GNAT family N-acetyltransferase n=1 Tax=Kocuria tytonis TaxID=2054280 RepID=A0A495A8M8_9MICC|nr:GNAT family N-acetyltransferase [Kocuria tytonis]RKQ36182.1 GNAT family N-acetyltransferase [Kocuria tytonis]
MSKNQEAPEGSARRIEIVTATPADTPGAAATLAAAFATDAHVVGMLPRGDVARPLTLLWERILLETFHAGGHAYLAVSPGESRPLGVALWEAPGSKVSIPQMLPGVVAYLRIFRSRFPDAFTTELLAQRAHPRTPHWYLKAVGTLPEAQGTGVGTRLVQERLAVVDRQRAGTYLEASTTDLIPYYERFGFVSRGPVPCRGTVPATGMWRPPVG